MTPVLAAELPPVDACPSCPPGIPDAALPLSAPEAADGETLASYECGACGTAWQTLFDAHWWAIDRSIAPVKDAATRRAA